MIDINNSLLLIVDIQGKLARIVEDSEKVISKAQTLIKACQLLEIPILACEQLPDKIGDTVFEIKDLLLDQKFFPKAEFSSLANENIRNEFERFNKKNIIVIGIETHICVHQTVKDLLAIGTKDVYVLADVVSSRSGFDRQQAISNMALQGANIYTLEMLLFELLGSAKHTHFREISKMIK